MTGDPPPPCSNFSVTAVSDTRALMFGGYQHEGIRLKDVYIAEFGKENVVKAVFSLVSICCYWFLSCPHFLFHCVSSFGQRYPLLLLIQHYSGQLELAITLWHLHQVFTAPNLVLAW